MGRSADDEIATAELRAKVVALRREGATFQAIGEECGFSKQRAHEVYHEALDSIPAMEIKQYRAEQQERLDQLLRLANDVIGRDHVIVSQGRVMYETTATGDKVRLLDDGPKLQAARTILAIEERRAKLLGLDAPVKTDVSGETSVKVVLVGVDVEAIG